MIDLHERVAALEADRETDRQIIVEIRDHLKSIDEHNNKIKGIFGAVWFFISCIGIFLSGLKFLHKG